MTLGMNSLWLFMFSLLACYDGCMNNSNKYHIIAGIVLALAGVIGSITLDESKYSLISLVGVMFLLAAQRTDKK